MSKVTLYVLPDTLTNLANGGVPFQMRAFEGPSKHLVPVDVELDHLSIRLEHPTCIAEWTIPAGTTLAQLQKSPQESYWDDYFAGQPCMATRPVSEMTAEQFKKGAEVAFDTETHMADAYKYCAGKRLAGHPIDESGHFGPGLLDQLTKSARQGGKTETMTNRVEAYLKYLGRSFDHVVIDDLRGEPEYPVFDQVCRRIDPEKDATVFWASEEDDDIEVDFEIHINERIASKVTPDTAADLEDRLRRALAILKGDK